MTKIKKIRYRIAFAIIDKFSHVVYRLREKHLVVIGDKLDQAADYYYCKLGLDQELFEVDLDSIDWNCCPDYARKIGKLPPITETAAK
jgi:hypothetical protein